MKAELEVVTPPESKTATRNVLAGLRRLHVVDTPSADPKKARIFVSWASTSTSESDVTSWLDGRFRQGKTFSAPIFVWDVDTPEGVRFAQVAAVLSARLRCSPLIAHDPAVVRRIAVAKMHGAEKSLVASATLTGSIVEVWSCEPRLYRVPVAKIPALASLSRSDLASFAVSASGSRIHWDAGDVDLNMDAIRAAVDPVERRAQRAQFTAEAKKYGAAIRRLRMAHGLKQSEIARVDERTIRRIERGAVMPRSGTLALLASAHGMPVPEYLAAIAGRIKTGAR